MTTLTLSSFRKTLPYLDMRLGVAYLPIPQGAAHTTIMSKKVKKSKLHNPAKTNSHGNPGGKSDEVMSATYAMRLALKELWKTDPLNFNKRATWLRDSIPNTNGCECCTAAMQEWGRMILTGAYRG